MIGIKVFIYELGGGLVEVMAIGTAITQALRRLDPQRAAHSPGDHPRSRHILRSAARCPGAAKAKNLDRT